MLSNITVKAVTACGLHLTLRDKAQRPLPTTLDIICRITLGLAVPAANEMSRSLRSVQSANALRIPL